MIQSGYENGFDCGHEDAKKYDIMEYHNCRISAMLCDECKKEYDETKKKLEGIIQ